MRTLYYPSYSLTELGSDPRRVRLDPHKASRLIHTAIALHATGFPIPVPPEANANDHDRAYEWLARQTQMQSHMARTRDVPFDGVGEQLASFCGTNSLHTVFWNWTAHCPGHHLLTAARERFNL